MENKKFKVRDLRKRGWFRVDDFYINGYAKLLGESATLVYLSLCRHADKHQEAFPSQERIAKQHKISVRTVRRGVEKLKSANLISIEREKTTQGKWLNNLYILLDKSEWKKPEDIIDLWIKRKNQGSNQTKTKGQTSPNKETQVKETQKNVAPDVATVYPSFLDRLLKSNQGHIRVIGIWVREKGIDLQNKEMMASVIKRNLRPAKLLVGYKDEDIVETIWVLKNTDYLKKFTLETVGKYIDEVVAQKKKQGPKIVRFEKRVVDGRVVMRPIY